MRQRILRAIAGAIAICLVTAGAAQTAFSSQPPLPPQAHAEWARDVTVLVIAPDGTWGTATEPFVHQALAGAIARCKSRYRHEIGCGYRSTSIRAGWSLALRCGRENIIVAAKTLRAVEQAAVDAELNLRRDYYPDMPPCVRVVSINPQGDIIAPDVGRLLRFVIDQGR